MALIRKAKKLGNSAGVLLPKKLLGSDVKIVVVKRPLNIKKETFKLLSQYFPDILGIYITNKSPVEILAASYNIHETINSDKVKINIVPLTIIKRDIKTKQALKQKLAKAETIFNRHLLIELKKQIKSARL